MSTKEDPPPRPRKEVRLFIFSCRDCGRQTRLTWDETQQERACAGCGRTISVDEIEMLLEAPTQRVIRPIRPLLKKDKEEKHPE